MCGIAGVIGIESTAKAERGLRAMLSSIVHRGPDEEGTIIAPGVAAGARRLSIIDLPGGSQPVWNERGTLAVLFNGEIYNFRSLRKELAASGHRFGSVSDTEVIVHAYEAWGDDCVHHLEGMFAFAVIELPGGSKAQAKRVFLARDRLGIKPLYYSVANGTSCFASEMRAIVVSGLVQPSLCADAIASYLLFGAVSEPLSIVDGIRALPPGSSLSIDPADPARHAEPKPYWNPSKTAALSCNPDVAPARRVRSLLQSAVESHLVADVPVGVFLSGGIDSTAIAAIASRTQPGIHTFTIAFPEAEFNEAAIARRTAQSLNTQHGEISISGGEMLSRLEDAVAAFDQPTADGVNTYFVSWAARQAGLKVALSGLGSDELFGGYSSFRATRRFARLAGIARVLPNSVRSSVAALIASASFPITRGDSLRKISAVLAGSDDLPHPYFFTRLLFTPATVASVMREHPLYGDSSPWWLSAAAATQQAREMDSFTATSWLEIRSYLLNMLLRDTDGMSMCHSLEVRVPFLDHHLVGYVLTLQEAVKHSPERPKSLLIDAVRDLLPQEIIAQRKRTFTFPWEVWLRGKLRERIEAGLDEWSLALEPHISPSFARAVWADFLARRTTWSRPWSLFVLNEWTKRYMASRSLAACEPWVNRVTAV